MLQKLGMLAMGVMGKDIVAKTDINVFKETLLQHENFGIVCKTLVDCAEHSSLDTSHDNTFKMLNLVFENIDTIDGSSEFSFENIISNVLSKTVAKKEVSTVVAQEQTVVDMTLS